MGKDNLNSGKAGQRNRYWSLMLVGEHGRIIPFKHFKGIAIAAAAVVVLAFGALVVLGIAYSHQAITINRLQDELAGMQQQAAKLRDEKDLLMTKLVVTKEKPDSTAPAEPQASRQADAESQDAPSPPPEVNSPSASASRSTAPPANTVPKPPAATLKAAIKGFKVTYDGERNILMAVFKVYNTSTPKVPLSGRTVVVFKKQGDPSIQWISVPRVPLNDEQPSGKQGQAFKINNYRTIQLKAYGLKPPVRYNTAVAFVFSGKGDLLLSEELSFHVDFQPPPPTEVKAPAPPAPTKGDGVEKPAMEPESTSALPDAGDKTHPSGQPQIKSSPAPTRPSPTPAVEAKPEVPAPEPAPEDQTTQPGAKAPDPPEPDPVVDQNQIKSPATPAKSQPQGERE